MRASEDVCFHILVVNVCFCFGESPACTRGLGVGRRCATPCFDNLSMSMSVAFHGDLCSYTYTRVNRKVLRQMKVFDFSFFFSSGFFIPQKYTTQNKRDLDFSV